MQENTVNLADYFPSDQIVRRVSATDFAGVIDEVVQRLVVNSSSLDSRTLIAAIHEREAQATTAVGRGFAFPHARTELVEKVRCCLGLSEAGIAMPSPDGKPVHAFVVFFTPRNISRAYLQVLSAFAALARRDGVLSRLLKAPDEAAIHDVLSEGGDIPPLSE
jgi:PTS system fructose-specific IIC component